MSKKNKNKNDFAKMLDERPVANPLAAAPQEVVTSDLPEDLSELQDSDASEQSEEEVTTGPLGGGVHPSEWDPDSEPVNRFGAEDDYTPPTDHYKREYDAKPVDSRPEAPVKPNTPTGINRLGHPIVESHDPSKGFYQGIDPVTGERIYSGK